MIQSTGLFASSSGHHPPIWLTLTSDPNSNLEPHFPSLRLHSPPSQSQSTVALNPPLHLPLLQPTSNPPKVHHTLPISPKNILRSPNPTALRPALVLQLLQPIYQVLELSLLIRTHPLCRQLHVEPVDDYFFTKRTLLDRQDWVDSFNRIGRGA